ncbi:MAG: DEAD/DEAH box helicase, partial [Rhodospirillales bacterium]|nr:DEAD/DEAH box helicase [Rhodospirillales bacterium]
MRPEILYPLFAPVTSLAGVGPRIATLVERVAGPHLVDLLWHLPTGLIDRRYAPEVGEAQPGRIATLTVQVDRHQLSPNRRLPYKVFCSDETGTIALVFFHARPDYLKRALPEGETRLVSGKVERFGQELQITHPDHMGGLEDKELLQVVEPVHGLTQGLSLKVMGKAVRGALAQVPELDEWIDLSFLAKQKWAPWRESLIAAHAPEEETSLEPHDPNRMRLAYDELLANQLALMLVRQRSHRMAGRRVKGDGSLAKLVMGALPFELTVSQSRALEEIQGDMAEDTRMHRLLQGDVGSGKTLVAVAAMLNAVENGYQAALMAPTEILAEQHYINMRQWV